MRRIDMESDIWAGIGTGRIADAIYFLGGIIAIWVSARFASVAVEKDANIVAKITITIFGICVVVTNCFAILMQQYTWVGAARNLQALKDSGVSLSPGATEYLAMFAGASDPSLLDKPVALLLNLSALALIIGILWFQPKSEE